MTSRSRSRNNSLVGGGSYSLGTSTNYGTTSLVNSIYTNSTSSGYNPTYSPNYSSYSSSRLNSGLSNISSTGTKELLSKYSSSSGYSSSPVTSTPTISKKYTGAKTDTDYSISFGKSPSSWRSRSIDSNGIGSYRDRSASREASEFSYRNPLRDPSLGRDYRDSSSSSYNPVSDNIIRPFSATNSLLPLSPTRQRSNLTSLKFSINNEIVASSAASILSRGSPLVRSSSFHELRDIGSPVTSSRHTPRTRHQTLPYGVSDADLQRAKSNLNLSTKTSSSTGWRGSSSELGYTNGYSRSALDLGYGSQPSSRRDSIVSIKNYL